MEMNIENKHITFSKELSKLDELALHFSEKLIAVGIEHVFLSGYVAILFGRNRSSEDIDVVCEKVPFETFAMFWDEIHKTLECINTSNVRTAYEDYLQQGVAVRFAYKGKMIPNVELKFLRTDMHKEALSGSYVVVVNKRHLPIPQLEQQISYKLFMGSEKDIEDARFLFKLFFEYLNKQNLIMFLKELRVPIPEAKRYLGWSD